MHILKLALPLAGLLVSGQPLAHKAPRAMPTTMASTRAALAQTDTNPDALLEGMRGRNAKATFAAPARALHAAIAKKAFTSARINHRH